MQFGPKRGSILYIFDNFIKDFGLLIIALAIGAYQGDIIGVLTDNVFVLVIVLVAPITRLLDYLFTIYEVDDTKLIIKKGFLNKKVTEVPISTITTIDLSQNIVCQITGRYKLKVDNVSNMANNNDQSKVNMIFGKEDALTLKEILETKKNAVNGANLASKESSGFDDEQASIADKQNKEDIVESKFQVSAGKIILMGLLETKGLLIVEGFGAFMVLFGFLQDKTVDDLMAKVIILSYLVVLVLVAAFIVVVMCVGAIMSVVRFAGFTVTNRENSIGIRYGLLTKKSFTLDKDRISGFSYKQSWLMRRFKVGTLEVFAIGFGFDSDDSNERAVLHPLLPEAELKNFMTNFLDEFDADCELEKPDKGALRYFFYRFTFVAATVLLIASIVVSKLWVHWMWVIGVILFTVCIASRIMEYHNTRVGGNKQNIQLVSGGLNTQRTFIKTDNVESISDRGSIWKRKRGYISLHIDFLGPVATTSVEVYNLKKVCSDKLRALLVY